MRRTRAFVLLVTLAACRDATAPTAGYTLDVRFRTTPSADVQRAFVSAAKRIAEVIVADVPDVSLVGFDASRCGGPASVTERADDLIVYADLSAIDGPGGIVARAGPCLVRSDLQLTVIGTMQFDVADAQALLGSERFGSVVLHEMLHVLGFGSLWRSHSLVTAEATADPRFVGAQGTRRCSALGFAAPCGMGSVPVENTGGNAIAGSHWRESVFDAELMTGFAESSASMPLSVLTIGSLEDLGYTVNYAAADAYAPPPAARVALPAAGHDTPFDEVLRPFGHVTGAGVIRLQY